MSDRMSQIENKLDSVIEKLHDIHIVLSENTQSLIIHEKRTDIAERKLEVLTERIEENKEKEHDQLKQISDSIQQKFDALEVKLSPVKTHVEVMEKVFNILWKVILPCFFGLIGLLYKMGIIKVG